MVYPPLPPLPPGPPGTSGWQYNQSLIPPPALSARLQAQAATGQRSAAEAALVSRRARMAGRWFTPEHAWAMIHGEIATVGLTEYATEELLDVLYVSLPEVGATVNASSPCGQVESVRAIWDLYAPGDGHVIEVNGQLDAEPGLINKEPFGDGWLFRMTLSDSGAVMHRSLLSPQQYEELTTSDG